MAGMSKMGHFQKNSWSAPCHFTLVTSRPWHTLQNPWQKDYVLLRKRRQVWMNYTLSHQTIVPNSIWFNNFKPVNIKAGHRFLFTTVSNNEIPFSNTAYFKELYLVRSTAVIPTEKRMFAPTARKQIANTTIILHHLEEETMGYPVNTASSANENQEPNSNRYYQERIPNMGSMTGRICTCTETY